MAVEPTQYDEDALLADLKSGVISTKRSAARNLGGLPTSSPRVIEALIDARDNDWDGETRQIASESLASPVHRALIEQTPALRTVFQKVGQPGQPSVTPVATAPAVSYSWRETWLMALTRPSVATYELISQDVNASAQRAFIWLVITSVLARLILLILQIVLGQVGTDPQFGTLLIDAIGDSFVSVAAAFVDVGLIYLGARLFGGRARYSTLLYTMAAFTAPLMFVNILGSIVPDSVAGLFLLIVGLYELVLDVNAVKAVYKLKNFATCMVVIVIPAVILIGVVFLLYSAGVIQLPTAP